MPEEEPQPIGQFQWKIGPVKEDKVEFDCPDCTAHYSFDAETFKENPAEHIAALTATEQVVRRTFGNNILGLVVGVVVFIWVHRMLYGPVIQGGAHLIVPALASVIAYTLSNGLFQAIPLGRGVPMYRFECGQCQSEVLIASDGKSLALPAGESETEDQGGPEKAHAANGTNDPVDDPEGKKVGVN